MKRTVPLIGLLLMTLSIGCASRDYVQQQIEPLVDRISKLEAKECCERAEKAAQRAEKAAKRSEKAFELEQHK
ncbi:MAG TPA: hypothetical protein VK435_03215 [Thermodesulfovibrionales bacterium]|nr:hypothetical protein [Thermodesulfovibrionales bacterium]